MSNKIFIYFLIVFGYALVRLFVYRKKKMKKVFATLCFSLMCVCSAKAENVYRPYVGADVLFDKAKTDFIRPNYTGAAFYLGTTYNAYFGTEIFYQQTGTRAKTLGLNTKYKTSFRGYGLDAIINLPVYSKLDVHMSIGAACYVFNEKLSGFHRLSDEGVGYRFGGGAVYHFTNRLASRVQVRYIKFNDISNLRHTTEYVIGARYYFMEN